MNPHTPGPVETLARLSIQSLRYVPDEEFRNAVDAVIRKPMYDAAPDLLAIAKKIKAYGTISSSWIDELDAAIAKAQGGASDHDVDEDCAPNHPCQGRMVHLPIDEQCDKCGAA